MSGKGSLTLMRQGRAMARVFVVLSVVCLASCDTGTPEFWGADPVRVEAQGMTFDVRVKGLRAEALRKNTMLWAPERRIAAAATEAIGQATGCTVAALEGDPSVMQARLDCGAGAPRPPRPARAPLECEGEVISQPALDLEEVVLTCS